MEKLPPDVIAKSKRDKEARKRIRVAYSALFQAVSESLFKNDPMGINFGSNTDEYEPEVGTIIPRLFSCDTEGDVLSAVHEEFATWFGDSAGPKINYTEAASDIWRIWNEMRCDIIHREHNEQG